MQVGIGDSTTSMPIMIDHRQDRQVGQLYNEYE